MTNLARCLVIFAAFTAPLLAATDPLATLRPGHPRLLLTDEQLVQDLTAAQADPLRTAVHARIIALAEVQLKESRSRTC